MTFVCLWSPAWPTGAGSTAASASARAEHLGHPDARHDARSDAHAPFVALAATLLSHAPRVVVDVREGRTVLWADARGMNARALADGLLDLMRDDGVTDPCAGVATTPVAAELAAVRGTPGVTVVDAGTDRAYVALFPIAALDVPLRVKPLLFGLGISTCGELAALTRESIEVRLGADAVPLWRRARADDDRHDTLFAPMPRALPHATLEWMDYEVTDPARLLFVINALLENVCEALAGVGQGARELAVTFSLANKSTYVQPLVVSRPTPDRHAWVRVARTALERLKFPAAVTGIALRAVRVSEREARQSDLFDRGLASAEATEHAVVRLMDDQHGAVVVPRSSAHPLVEQRTAWVEPRSALARTVVPAVVPPPESPKKTHVRRGGMLTLHVSPEPRAIVVETVLRRDHFAPVRFRDANGWHEVVHAAGPDRVSGSVWDSARAYAREYFRCVTKEGALVWLFRAVAPGATGRGSEWFVHGWWD